MHRIEDDGVAQVFNNYPDHIRQKLMRLRQVILDTATEMEDVSKVEEALKWGEPSYLTKAGSTIRIAWRRSNPDQYAIYFHCQTKLVGTFRELYTDKFTFEGNRAMVFSGSDELPISELKHCISLSLTYHNIKNLPMLGV